MNFIIITHISCAGEKRVNGNMEFFFLLYDVMGNKTVNPILCAARELLECVEFLWHIKKNFN